MIPDLVPIPEAPWDVLPPGIHASTLIEVEAKFATNNVRRGLFEGLVKACRNLAFAGCVRLYLDGSYVTAKPAPGDYDACWDPAGVDRFKLDPVFSDFSNKRAAQKKVFGGEFFPASQAFIGFFQVDRFTGAHKGILLVSLAVDDRLLRKPSP